MGVFDSRRTSGRSNSIEKSEAKLILSDKTPWPVQEAYKALRTNITFSLPGTGCKVIAVSSAQQYDGKSTICINTAISFAQINKKVLLMECDLRLPTVGTKLGIRSVPGLSDTLIVNSMSSVRRWNGQPPISSRTLAEKKKPVPEIAAEAPSL